jgi:hypothetical protein
MRIPRISYFTFALASLLLTALAHGASVTGMVTNKTTNRPSAGDSVVLVDVQAGMNEAASATTDSSGHYSLNAPGMGPYLIRVNHQGGAYFIAAPQGGGSGDVNVYDVAAKVDGVSIDADMLLLEAAAGTLRVHERYLVRNTSLPPKAQFSDNTFEVVLPADAELDSASATRPGGLGTNTRLVPLSQKGHYTFNVPIQPDQGEKETLFEVMYHLLYNGKYTFTPHLQMPTDNLVVYAAKGIDFSGTQGVTFQSTQEDPRVQTFVAKGIHPGQGIAFTISGDGQMPAQAQGAGMGPQAGMAGASGDSANIGNTPGGGIGAPIDTPDPLPKYKWWILGALALVLIAGAAFLLRNPGGDFPGKQGLPREADFEPGTTPAPSRPAPAVAAPDAAPATSKAVLLNILKDELFAIESEKLSGTLSQSEYTEIKTGLEAVLKRALNRN